MKTKAQHMAASATQIETSLGQVFDSNDFSIDFVEPPMPLAPSPDYFLRLSVSTNPYEFTYTPAMRRLTTAGNFIKITLAPSANSKLSMAVREWLRSHREIQKAAPERVAQTWGAFPTDARMQQLLNGGSLMKARSPRAKRARSPRRAY